MVLLPLVVRIEPNAPYQVAGKIDGTVPRKHHDPSFDLDTEFYTGSFMLRVTIKPLAQDAPVAAVPLAVRYQMCSDTTCLPPKTVHLVAK